jgi:hypothetical protein
MESVYSGYQGVGSEVKDIRDLRHLLALEMAIRCVQSKGKGAA